MKKTLYQNTNKRFSLALFIVLTPLMALKGGGNANHFDTSAQKKVILKRENEIERERINKISDTIRFYKAWQRYKDSVDKVREERIDSSEQK